VRELERDHTEKSPSPAPVLEGRIAVVGAGRAGGSIAAAARAAGLDVSSGSRELDQGDARIVLL
jgi:hypothetical protein